MSLSRRALLAGAAAAAVVVAGTVEVIATSESDLVRVTLRRILGDIHISNAELGHFIEALEASWTGFEGYKGDFRKLSELSGLASLADAVPALRPDYVERYERLILTRFLSWTDHVDASRVGREAVFIGPAACLNPFAEFTFD